MAALAIQKGKTRQNSKCLPNLLPCRINHAGPANASSRYWAPQSDPQNGKSISHFRGRKLNGKTVKIPKAYKGLVLSQTERILEDAEEEKVVVVEELAEFDEIVVWGHEARPDDLADPYVRGVEEWISFAEQIHSHGDDIAENGER